MVEGDDLTRHTHERWAKDESVGRSVFYLILHDQCLTLVNEMVAWSKLCEAI